MKQKTIVNRGKSKSTSVTEETLVDQALKLDLLIKEKEKELDALKEKLKEQAKLDGVMEIQGVFGVAKISDAISWEIDTHKLVAWLKKNKKPELAFSLLKPSVGNIKKYLGELPMKEFGKKETAVCSKVRLEEK